MKRIPAPFAQPLLLVIVTAAFVCALASPLLAQRPPSTSDPRSIASREEQMNSLEREAARKNDPNKRDPKDTLAEVNEDLSRLKALNEVVSAHAAATDQQLDYKSIVESVTEIRKRAMRLKTDLALPQESKENRTAKKEGSGPSLQTALLGLNELLDSFLHNPIFSDSGAIDQELAAKARRDLEDIIVLSDKLRKSADKLNKASVKP